MNVEELKEQFEKQCELTHKPIDKQLQEYESWLECHDKKLKQKADQTDVDKKADQKEVDSLKEWLGKVDTRMWLMVSSAVIACIASITTLLVVLYRSASAG